MGNLSILINVDIKCIEIKKTLTDLEFFISIILTKMCFKSFGKGKNIKATLGFELVTCRFVVKALTHSGTMLGNTSEKKT